jgi:hypothetical protein
MKQHHDPEEICKLALKLVKACCDFRPVTEPDVVTHEKQYYKALDDMIEAEVDIEAYVAKHAPHLLPSVARDSL